MEVDDQRSEVEVPPDLTSSRQTIAVSSVSSAPSAANGNFSGTPIASTSSVQQLVRVPIGQLQIGARQPQQQQGQQQGRQQVQLQGRQQGQQQGHARLVLRTQQQQLPGQEDQLQYRAVRHVRPPTWLATQNAQQRQRVPPIAASHVVGTRPLPSISQQHQPPNLLQLERNREQQQRRQFQLSRGPDSEFKLSLPTRCVRFGTYKLSCQRPLEVTSEHINLVVIQDFPDARRYDDPGSHYQQAPKTSSIAFVISFKHIRRVEYSFTNGNSVMYLLVNEYCGRKIRESLGIDTELEAACADQTLSYFNPDSPYLYHQLITIVLDVSSYAASAAQELAVFFKTYVETRRSALKVVELRKTYGDETLIPAHVLHIDPLLRKLSNADARRRFADIFPPYMHQSGAVPVSSAPLYKPRATAGGVGKPTDNLARPPINARYAVGAPSTSYRNRMPQQQQTTQVITGAQVIVHAAKGSHVIVCQSPQMADANGHQIVGQMLPTGLSTGVGGASGRNLARHYQVYTTPQGLTTKVITIKKPPAKRIAAPTPNISQTILLEDEADGDEQQRRFQPSTSKCARVETLLAYPEGERDAVTVHVSDMECLNDEQFLNDTIIDFYLKYSLRQSSPELQKRVHVFNTFFWRRLTLRPRLNYSTASATTSSAMNATKHQSTINAKYSSVKSWTKDVDIFEKDFIIVPINEDAHWYLAIICYPMEAVKMDYNAAIKREMMMEAANLQGTTSLPANVNGKVKAEVKTEVKTEAKTEAGEEVATSRPWRPSPCIVLLDSLRDAVPNRYKTITTLKEYLLCEWRDKGKEKSTGCIFDRAVIKGSTPKNVPQQDNYWDCGVFVLEYAEQFLRRPPDDIFQGNKNDYSSWYPTFSVENKRSAVRELIKSMCTDEKWALVPPPIKVDKKPTGKECVRFELVCKSKEELLPSGRQSAPPISERMPSQNHRSHSSPPSINR